MFPAEWSFPISMHTPKITVICLNKARREITRRLLRSKRIASKYLANEWSGSYKSSPRSSPSSGQIKVLGGHCTAFVQSLVPQRWLSPPRALGLVLTGSGTLRRTRSSASAWMVVCSSAAFPPRAGKHRSPKCFVWGAPEVHMDNVGSQCKEREMLQGLKCCLQLQEILGP